MVVITKKFYYGVSVASQTGISYESKTLYNEDRVPVGLINLTRVKVTNNTIKPYAPVINVDAVMILHTGIINFTFIPIVYTDGRPRDSIVCNVINSYGKFSKNASVIRNVDMTDQSNTNYNNELVVSWEKL